MNKQAENKMSDQGECKTAVQADNIVLQAKDLGRTFDPGIWTLRHLNLELERGEFAAILGLSGSGKTTLFNILAGLDKPDEGCVEVTEEIGYMMQKDLLLPWKRVISNIALPLTMRGMTKREAQAEVQKHLADFGLEGLERRWPSQLSGGERQRAALLRTYLYAGNILLLDEPFSGLDAITRENMQTWLKEIKEQFRLTILLITHDIDEAIALTDTIHVLAPHHPASLHPPVIVTDRESTELRSLIRRLLYTGIEQV